MANETAWPAVSVTAAALLIAGGCATVRASACGAVAAGGERDALGQGTGFTGGGLRRQAGGSGDREGARLAGSERRARGAGDRRRVEQGQRERLPEHGDAAGAAVNAEDRGAARRG